MDLPPRAILENCPRRLGITLVILQLLAPRLNRSSAFCIIPPRQIKDGTAKLESGMLRILESREAANRTNLFPSYTDFLVNEVAKDGSVIRLNAFVIVDESKLKVSLAENSDWGLKRAN